MFDTIFHRGDGSAFINIVIPGVGKVQHDFSIPGELHKAIYDYATAQANIKVAEIQANMTAKTVNQANGTKG